MRRFVWLLVLSASLALAAEPEKPRYVTIEKSKKGTRGTMPLWTNFDAAKACMTAAELRRQAGITGAQAFETKPCYEGRLANLTHGTEVEVVSPAPDCGSFAKVRVKSGEQAGKVGCVPPDGLGPERVP